MSHFRTSCAPPGLNGASPVVTTPGAPGLGARILRSNLDATGMRIVRKGCVVEFRGGAVARVSKVRTGSFWTDARLSTGGYSVHFCCDVKVLP